MTTKVAQPVARYTRYNCDYICYWLALVRSGFIPICNASEPIKTK